MRGRHTAYDKLLEVRMLRDVHNRLRPLGIADVLDEMIELYKSNFVLLVGICAFLYVPYSVISANLSSPSFKIETATPQETAALVARVLIALLFYAVATPVVTGALTYGISERYLDRRTSIGACYRRMLNAGLLVKFFATNLLVFLAGSAALMVSAVLMVGGIALIVVGIGSTPVAAIGGVLLSLLGVASLVLPITVWMRLLAVAPAFVLERRGVTGSLSRSWDLMKGGVWKAFLLVFVVGVATSLIQGVITSPILAVMAMGAVRGSEPSMLLLVIHTVLQTILGTIFAPFTSIVAILLYYDMRIRKEGFDLELLAGDLEAGARRFDADRTVALPQEELQPAHYPEETRPGGEA